MIALGKPNPKKTVVTPKPFIYKAYSPLDAAPKIRAIKTDEMNPSSMFMICDVYELVIFFAKDNLSKFS